MNTQQASKPVTNSFGSSSGLKVWIWVAPVVSTSNPSFGRPIPPHPQQARACHGPNQYIHIIRLARWVAASVCQPPKGWLLVASYSDWLLFSPQCGPTLADLGPFWVVKQPPIDTHIETTHNVVYLVSYPGLYGVLNFVSHLVLYLVSCIVSYPVPYAVSHPVMYSVLYLVSFVVVYLCAVPCVVRCIV